MLAASLPMYDMHETRKATNAFWQGVAWHMRHEGVEDVPGALLHDVDLHRLWSDPNLFFSQCCGFDVVHRYKDQLRVIGTPCFAAAGCGGSDYASFVVVAESCPFDDVLDMPGAIAVINGPESQSGMNALFTLVAPQGGDDLFFSEIKISGSHAGSLSMIQQNLAQVAAIDCMTYSLIERHRPETLAGTRRLGATYPAPAPPYVTQVSGGPERLARMRAALAEAFADANLRDVRGDLLLGGIEWVPQTTYEEAIDPAWFGKLSRVEGWHGVA